MIRSEIENSVEFIRLQKAIKATMQGIAYHAVMRSDYDENYTEDKIYRKVCEDVNTSFSAIANCFEEFTCICDTMCRDFAKSEIHCAIEQFKSLNQPLHTCHDYFEQVINAEGVLEDILDMTSEDFDIDAVLED